MTKKHLADNALGARLAALETQMEADRERLTARLNKSERKLRVTWAISALAAVALFTMGWHKDAIAQGYGMTLQQAATRISTLETKTASMSVVSANDSTNTSGQQTVRFSGVNVQIVDGTGATEGTQSGVGNLIIGYNEKRDGVFVDNTRTGNHNLIAGVRNSYGGNGGVVFGYQNRISSLEATVTGGRDNRAIGQYASVSGGQFGTASGLVSSVSGGYGNTADNFAASVSGGSNNAADGTYSSISGGSQNAASGDNSSISGGPERIITTNGGWVAGRRTGTSYTGYYNSP